MLGMDNDVPLTAAEAGAILGVSSRTIHRRAETGELTYWRKLPGPNGDFLFRRADVVALRDQLAAQAAS